MRLALLAGIDDLATSAASIVVVDTDEHLRMLPARRRHTGVVVPTGAPEAYYGEVPCGNEWPLRVVFSGTYLPLQARS